MKNLILACLAAFVLVSVIGCSNDSDRTTSTAQSAPMQTDAKDMKK
jgi:uncharacterized protein YcfL